MRTKALSMSALLVVLTLSLTAQQPAPPAPAPRPGAGDQPAMTFKVEINYVEIDAVVTDAQGNFVRNLTKDDFQVFEQGKPQTVTAFSLIDIPVQKFDPPLYKVKPIEPDVRNNKDEFDGRIFVIVLDDLHTSFQRSGRVKAAAKQFIDRYLGANDVAAVVQTGGVKGGAQEFTSSHERLARAVDRFIGQKERSATLEKIDDYNRNQMSGSTAAPRDTSDQIRAYKARNTFATLKNTADYLAGIRGRRKAVVFISEGIDYDIYDQITNINATDVRAAGQDAIAAATRANVSFYAVDPRGLVGLDVDAGDIQSFPTDTSLGLGTTALLNEMRIAQDSLRTIADETGGFAAVNSNDYQTSFARIIQANSSYYILGYYSNDAKRDGQFRTVNVRVKPPGLQVRARKGYVAPKGRAAPPGTPPPPGIAASIAMREAMNSPVPVTGLGLSAFAAPMAGAVANRPKASVLAVVEIDGSALKFKQEGGLFANDIEVAIVATDDAGKVQEGVKDSAKLQLKPETHDSIVKTGIRMTRRLELPPGRYQLKIGARESVGGLVGSVIYDLDVPDFTKGDVAMGGLLLTAASASRMPTANPDPDFKNILPASPIATRVFPTGDQLDLAVDVYDNRPTPPHRVEIRTTLTGDTGNVVFSQRDERRTEELKGANGTFGHVATVPLKGVAPGRYVLKVEAQSLLTNGASASREVEITVQ
jgi:VWFA-related protein